MAYEDTPIIDALHKFVYKRVSALPIVDSEVYIIIIIIIIIYKNQAEGKAKVVTAVGGTYRYLNAALAI